MKLFLLLALAWPAFAGGRSDEVAAHHLAEVLNAPEGERHFSGSPVSLDAKDAPVADVFRLLAARSGLNFIWDDDVGELKVSLAVKNVPWDQLLDLIVRQKNLKVFVQGNVVELLTSERFLRRLEEKWRELRGDSGAISAAVLPVAFADARGMAHLLRALVEESPGEKP